MSMSQRANLVETRLAELERLDPDSLTPEQLADYARLRREHEFNEQEQAREQQEGQRDAADRERQEAEFAEAFARHRRERADREQLLAEAEQLRRRADELEALYHAGASRADVPPPLPNLAGMLNAHAAADARPGRRTQGEPLSASQLAAAELDPDTTLNVSQAAALLAARGVKPRTIQKFRRLGMKTERV